MALLVRRSTEAVGVLHAELGAREARAHADGRRDPVDILVDLRHALDLGCVIQGGVSSFTYSNTNNTLILVRNTCILL